MVEPIEKSERQSTRAFNILKTVLAVWGALSLVVIILFIVGTVSFLSGTSAPPRVDRATISDVGFVLKRSGLGAKRIESVPHSYKTDIHFSGDHLFAYAMKVKSVTAEELVGLTDGYRRWTRGDLAEGVLKKAIEFAGSWNELDWRQWFPDKGLLLSDEVYVYPLTIESYEYGGRVVEARLIFAVPSRDMVYYFSGQV